MTTNRRNNRKHRHQRGNDDRHNCTSHPHKDTNKKLQDASSSSSSSSQLLPPIMLMQETSSFASEAIFPPLHFPENVFRFHERNETGRTAGSSIPYERNETGRTAESSIPVKAAGESARQVASDVSYNCPRIAEQSNRSFLSSAFDNQNHSLTAPDVSAAAIASSTTKDLSLLNEIIDEFCSMTDATQRIQPPPISTNNTEIRLLTDSIDTLKVHKVLGSGEFASVSLVTVEQKRRSSVNTYNDVRYYACKSVKKSLSAVLANDNNNSETAELDRSEYVNAVGQLINEIHVLSNLEYHPNIIRIQGLNSEDLFGSYTSSLGLFFLMDVLDETLDRRIDRWMGEQHPHQQSQRYGSNSNSNRRDVHPHLLTIRDHQRNIEKYNICLQLASALEYIHSRNIVYRDLKPQNIGFLSDNNSTATTTTDDDDEKVVNNQSGCRNGINRSSLRGERLQLFDFGLCCELSPTRQEANGIIGTMRYMSPEVCLDMKYGVAADVYSYGILCWEIWTHNLPFDQFTPDLYRYWVCHHKYRPPDYDRDHYPCCDNSNCDISTMMVANPPPREVRNLLSGTWEHNPSDRLKWSQIQNQLTLMKQIEHLRMRDCMMTTAS